MTDETENISELILKRINDLRNDNKFTREALLTFGRQIVQFWIDLAGSKTQSPTCARISRACALTLCCSKTRTSIGTARFLRFCTVSMNNRSRDTPAVDEFEETISFRANVTGLSHTC